MTGADNQQPRREHIGWLAGMIDGEGWVGLSSHNRGTHQGYGPAIHLVGTNKEGLDHLDKILTQLQIGHHVYWKRPTGFGKQLSWSVQINGMKRTRHLLDVVQQYLVIKQRQAEILCAWLELRAAQPVHSAITMREVELVHLMRKANSRRLNDYTPDIVARQIGTPGIGPLNDERVAVLKEHGVKLPDNLKECPACFAPFMPKRSDQIHCSERCANRLGMRRHRAKMKIESALHGDVQTAAEMTADARQSLAVNS